MCLPPTSPLSNPPQSIMKDTNVNLKRNMNTSSYNDVLVDVFITVKFVLETTITISAQNNNKYFKFFLF